MKVVTEDIRRSTEVDLYEESVEIEGSVHTGANLKVRGDLTILGDVEDARIEADGRVKIGGGFLGTGRGRVLSGGNFSAAFVQGQRIEAGGDVEITKTLLSATVFARGNLRTGKDEGAIVGGAIHTGGWVETSVLGSRRPVQTRIEAGVDPVLALRIEEMEREAMELTRKRIGFLKDAAAIAKRPASDGVGESALDMKAAADAMQADIVAAGEEIIRLRRDTSIDHEATVTVARMCYPPVEISICFSKLLHEAKTGPVVFRLFEDRIVLDNWTLE